VNFLGFNEIDLPFFISDLVHGSPDLNVQENSENSNDQHCQNQPENQVQEIWKQVIDTEEYIPDYSEHQSEFDMPLPCRYLIVTGSSVLS
jgi:hypothetical protein